MINFTKSKSTKQSYRGTWGSSKQLQRALYWRFHIKTTLYPTFGLTHDDSKEEAEPCRVYISLTYISILVGFSIRLKEFISISYRY